MAKIAVMGDYDSIYGFAALGLETYPVDSQEQAEKAAAPAGRARLCRDLHDRSAGGQQLAAEVSRYRTAMTPGHYPDPRRGREHGAGHPERQAVRRAGGRLRYPVLQSIRKVGETAHE